MQIIDTNCSFGHWPIQQFPYRTLDDLDRAMKDVGITTSWLSAVESILFPDPDVYDFALFQRLRKYPRFRPVKTVNPLLANWEDSCLKAIENYDIAGLKVYPNYHGYVSNHLNLRNVADFAAEHRVPLLVSARVNDERNQPSCLQVLPTNIDFFVSWAQNHPDTQFIVQCLNLGELGKLGAWGHISADIAFLDEADAILWATGKMGFSARRLVLGTHASFLYPQAAVLKLQFSSAAPGIINQIAYENAQNQNLSSAFPRS